VWCVWVCGVCVCEVYVSVVNVCVGLFVCVGCVCVCVCGVCVLCVLFVWGGCA